MKLQIKEISWGIDRRDGALKSRVCEKKTFPCVVGVLPTFAAGRRTFCIDEVGDDYLVLSLYRKDPAQNHPLARHVWTIRQGEKAGYFPRSLDGGYRYEFSVI